MKDISLAGQWVGKKHKPFIIAEMSGNHNQSLDHALAIVDAAAKAKVHALKIQTYTPDTMTLNLADNEFVISSQESLWHGQSLYQLYEKAHTPWEWHKIIFERCQKLGLPVFSTPFDESAVDFLETLNVPFYKIASFENTHLPLIRKVALTGKPIIISTGMASFEELEETVDAAREAGCIDLILLKCTSTYPANACNSNILTIPDMRKKFKCHIGLSDHTLGMGVALASVPLGACVIEKHFTIERAAGGVDAAFSMEPYEMSQLVIESERAFEALGNVKYGPTESEQASLLFRRSLYVVEDIEKGEVFCEKNIKAIRPGLGLPIKYLDQFKGKLANRPIKKGEPLAWSMLDQ